MMHPDCDHPDAADVLGATDHVQNCRNLTQVVAIMWVVEWPANLNLGLRDLFFDSRTNVR